MTVDVTYYPVPIDDTQKCRALVKPTMLLDVIDEFIIKYPEHRYDLKKRTMQIRVNGEIIPPTKWHICMLEKGDHIELVKTVHGSNKGGILSIIVGIILIIIGVVFFAPSGGGTSPLVAAGIALIAGGVISLIIGPPDLGMPPPMLASGSHASDDPVYRWDGRQIQFGTGNRIGIVYGETRVSPQVIMQYVETDSTGTKSYINLLLSLGWGPIEGIMKADGSGVCTSTSDEPDILVNNQPYSRYSEHFSWDFRLGEASQQSVISNFKKTYNFAADGTEFTKAGGALVWGPTYTEVDEVWIHVATPSLYHKPDGSNDIEENSVDYTIHYTTDMSLHPAWILMGNYTITGRQKSTYHKVVKFPLPANEKYKLKITRSSADQKDDFMAASNTILEGVTEISYTEVAYRGLALLSLRALATEHLSGGTPNIVPLVRGKKVTVPMLTEHADGGGTLYNFEDCLWDDVEEKWRFNSIDNAAPIYHAIIGGELQYINQFTCDPIWQAHDMATSTVHGLGDYMNIDKVDKVELLEESKYTHSIVYMQDGSYEKRFICNLQISKARNGRSAIAEILKSCRGWAYWVENRIKILIDRDSESVYAFNKSNIVEKSFKMNLMAKSAIPNSMEVVWDNLGDKNGLNRFRLFDENELKKGKPIKPGSIELHGVTRYSQAIRDGWFLLNSMRFRTKTVEFDSGINATHCQPGDVVTIQNDVSGWGSGGKILGSGSTNAEGGFVLYLDEYVAIAANKTYCVANVKTNGDLDIQEVIDPVGTYNKLSVYGPWEEEPVQGGMWLFGEKEYVGKKFRILSIARKTIDKVTITALEHNPSIYGHYSSAGRVESPPTFPGPNDPPGPVTDLTLTELTTIPGFTVTFSVPYTVIGGIFIRDPNFYQAVVQMSLDNITYHTRTIVYEDGNFDITGLTPGVTYYIKVYSQNKSGVQSLTVPSESITLVNINDPPGTVRGLEIEGQGNDTTFRGYDVKFAWNPVVIIGGLGGGGLGNDPLDSGVTSTNIHYELKFYIEDDNNIWQKIGNTRVVYNNYYTYTYVENIADNGGIPIPIFRLKVWAVDEFGNRSTLPAILTVNNGVPITPTGLTVDFISRHLIVNWDPSSELDHIKYVLTLNGVVRHITDNKYTYSYEENVIDSLTQDPPLPYGDPSVDVDLQDFDAYMQISGKRETAATNAPPVHPSYINATGLTRSVSFVWPKSTETDVVGYRYQIKVGSRNWTTAMDIEGTALTYALDDDDVASEGTDTLVTIRVWSVDIFNQQSVSYATSYDNSISMDEQQFAGDIFDIIPSDSFGNTTEDLAELYNGDYISDGITYTPTTGDAWMQIKYPVQHIFSGIIAWSTTNTVDSTSTGVYFAYEPTTDGNDWTYLKTDGETPEGTVEASNLADAQANLITLTDGKSAFLMAPMRQARRVRIYIPNSSNITLHEFKPNTLVIGDEIIANCLSAITANLGEVTVGTIGGDVCVSGSCACCLDTAIQPGGQIVGDGVQIGIGRQITSIDLQGMCIYTTTGVNNTIFNSSGICSHDDGGFMTTQICNGEMYAGKFVAVYGTIPEDKTLLDNMEYSTLSGGQLSLHIPGFGTHPYLSRIEFGCACASGTGVVPEGKLVELKGWLMKPKVVVGINCLMSYDHTNAGSPQGWCVFTTDPEEWWDGPTYCGYCFEVCAMLTIFGNSFPEYPFVISNGCLVNQSGGTLTLDPAFDESLPTGVACGNAPGAGWVYTHNNVVETKVYLKFNKYGYDPPTQPVLLYAGYICYRICWQNYDYGSGGSDASGYDEYCYAQFCAAEECLRVHCKVERGITFPSTCKWRICVQRISSGKNGNSLFYYTPTLLNAIATKNNSSATAPTNYRGDTETSSEAAATCTTSKSVSFTMPSAASAGVVEKICLQYYVDLSNGGGHQDFDEGAGGPHMYSYDNIGNSKYQGASNQDWFHAAGCGHPWTWDVTDTVYHNQEHASFVSSLTAHTCTKGRSAYYMCDQDPPWWWCAGTVIRDMIQTVYYYPSVTVGYDSEYDCCAQIVALKDTTGTVTVLDPDGCMSWFAIAQK